jgi:hypothetical protein
VGSVPFDSARKTVDRLVQIQVQGWLYTRVDQVVGRNTESQGISQQLPLEEEPLETVTTQVEPVDRPVEATGQVPANLRKRPSTERLVGHSYAINVGHDLRHVIEDEQPPSIAAASHCIPAPHQVSSRTGR